MLKSKRLYFALIGMLVVLGLSGCRDRVPTLDLPTLIPTEHLPTVIAQTVQALVSQSASPTPEPGVQNPETTILATAFDSPGEEGTSIPTASPQADPPDEFAPTPWVTATPQPPSEIPYADIQFVSPGALSKVISPIDLHAFLVPGEAGRARLELFGEDSRLMYRKLFVFGSPLGIQTNLRTKIDFEINGVAETAKLVISVDDSYGRLMTLVSQDLILLSLGDTDLNTPGDFLGPIVIQEPESKVLIQGGTLVVSGLARTGSEQPLLVELITTDGKVIGNRLAGIAPEPKGGHRLFAAEVSYTVYSPTWVRVTVSEWSDQLGAPVQLSSVEVLLGP
ncbi:MAG: hypothetical protein MUO62_04370 [Anaerolineales bacterium]|nr:hypothetical protein [Anaerolineales bacterium]